MIICRVECTLNKRAWEKTTKKEIAILLANENVQVKGGGE